jgi:hypothetical protein
VAFHRREPVFDDVDLIKVALGAADWRALMNTAATFGFITCGLNVTAEW